MQLGQSLQHGTVAEGIERPQELLVLRRQGCTTGQGYHFSPPVTADRLGALLGEQSGTPAEGAAAASAPVAVPASLRMSAGSAR